MFERFNNIYKWVFGTITIDSLKSKTDQKKSQGNQATKSELAI